MLLRPVLPLYTQHLGTMLAPTMHATHIAIVHI